MAMATMAQQAQLARRAPLHCSPHGREIPERRPGDLRPEGDESLAVEGDALRAVVTATRSTKSNGEAHRRGTSAAAARSQALPLAGPPSSAAGPRRSRRSLTEAQSLRPIRRYTIAKLMVITAANESDRLGLAFQKGTYSTNSWERS
jgi:hypothetical protein